MRHEFKVGDCVRWPTMIPGYGTARMNFGVVTKLVWTKPRIKGRTSYPAYQIRRDDGRMITAYNHVRLTVPPSPPEQAGR